MAERRTAILGCGPRAAEHAAAYQSFATGGRLVACCDLDAQRLEAFAAKFGIERRFGDLSEMLRAVRPDLLHVVAAPPFRPALLDVILRERPRAVLVEKPLAGRPEQGRAWIEGCSAAGIALFVNHQLRYHRPFQRVRELVESGALGRLEFGRGSCRGNLLEQGTHLFDMLSYFFGDGPVEWIFAQAEGAEGYASTHPAPTYAAGAALFPGGVHVGFECGAPAGTWRDEPVYWWNKGVELVGTHGRVGASTHHGWWSQTETAGLEGEVVPYPAEDLRAQARLTETILAALDDPERHQAHAGTARLSFDLAMAAQRSALLRRRVDPREPVADREIEALRAALARAESPA